MKPSEQCKQAGLKSLAELSELTGESVQTLNNWHKSKPERFEIVLIGAIAKKRSEGNKMENTISQDHLKGKIGRIYIARKGSIMVFLLENGESWFANCTAPSITITKGPVPDYWIHSIDWSGFFSDYFTFLMDFDAEDKPHYPKCEPSDSLTSERIAKLKANAARFQK